MSKPEHYEALILGSGEGGKYLAWHLARSGRRTAVVERRWIGGSCPNVNCLPSKNEIWSAKVADLVHHAAQFGMVTGPAAIDMGRVRQRKREMVEGLVAMHLEKYKASGAELVMGSGRFVPRRIRRTNAPAKRSSSFSRGEQNWRRSLDGSTPAKSVRLSARSSHWPTRL
jgi:pyruvate/2-oxoglutarate dehydrogenase complex dihydrolipoamide dehydrogenase (E3) component